jgi:hypothetical protein
MTRPIMVAVIGVLLVAGVSFGITRWQISDARAAGKAKADSAAAANAPMLAEQAKRDTLERLLNTVMERAQSMPNDSMLVISAANIAYNLLKTAAGNNIAIGPILLGCASPVTILTASATVRRLVNMTALTVVGANRPGYAPI